MARRIEVQIIGDASSLERAFGKAATSSRKLSIGIGTLIKSTIVFEATTKAIHGFNSALGLGIKEVKEHQQVQAQTAAVLKSTGDAAKVSAKHVQDLGLKLSNLSGIDDEAIQSGENLLLSFTNIRNGLGKNNKIFDEATKTVVDFAARTGKDIPTAAVLLGRALEDPAGKVAALSRAGIVFTKTQRDMIKQIQATKGVTAAQVVLLGELQKRFGGAAAAAGKTLPGQLAILRERFKDVAGGIVDLFVPGVTKAVTSITTFVKKLAAIKDTKAKFEFALEGGANLAKNLVEQVRAGLAGINWNAVLAETQKELTKAVRGVANAAAKVDWHAVGKKMGDGFKQAVDTLAASIKQVNWQQVGAAIINGLVAFLRGVDWGKVTKSLAQLLGAAIQATGDLLKGSIKALVGAIGDSFIRTFAPVGKAIESAIVKALLAVFKHLDVTILGVHIVPGVHSIVKKLQGTLTDLQAPPTVGAVKGASENVGRNAGATQENKTGSKTGTSGTGVNQAGVAATEAAAQAQLAAAAAAKARLKAEKAAAAELSKSLTALFAKFNLQIRAAQKTPGLKDDEAVLKQQLATVKDLLSTHKGNVQLQREEAKIIGEINGLHKKQTDQIKKTQEAMKQATDKVKNLFGQLFQPPSVSPRVFLGGAGGKQIAGPGTPASALLKNITNQNLAFKQLISAINQLRARGAPKGFIQQALSGEIPAEAILGIAQAPAKLQKQIFAQLRKAGSLITQAAKMEVKASKVTLRANTVTLAGAHAIPGGGFAPVRESGFIINGGLHLHGVQNPKQLQAELERLKKKQGSQRRGKLGGKR